jgi:hypothetical protein
MTGAGTPLDAGTRKYRSTSDMLNNSSVSTLTFLVGSPCRVCRMNREPSGDISATLPPKLPGADENGSTCFQAMESRTVKECRGSCASAQ